MKKVFVLVVLFLYGHISWASVYFTNVTNEWLQGRHTNVLYLAEQRLAANTNDIAGWLLKASWDFAHEDAAVLTNSMRRIISEGSKITTVAFSNVFSVTKLDVDCMMEYLKGETMMQRDADIEKSSRPGVMLHYVNELQALDEDGYFCADK